MWVSVLRSDTGGAFEAAWLPAFAEAAAAGGALPALRLVRTHLFISNRRAALLPDGRDTPIAVEPATRRPFPEPLLWLRDAALALSPTGRVVFLSGGQDTTKVGGGGGAQRVCDAAQGGLLPVLARQATCYGYVDRSCGVSVALAYR